MSDGGSATRLTRILVTLHASPSSLDWLEGAAAFAQRMNAELLGLFVEDVGLLRLAGLPFAREVGTLTSRSEPLSLGEMEQRLRAQASRAREALSQVTARHRLHSTFRVARGQVIGELLAAMEGVDAAALGGWGLETAHETQLGGSAQTLIDRASRPVLMVPPSGQVAPPIGVLYDGSPRAAKALEWAEELARRLGDLVVLLPARSAAAHQAVAREVSAAGAGAQGAHRFQALPDAEMTTVLKAASALRLGTIVIPADGPTQELNALRLLLRNGIAVLLAR
ncbi:MAG TPA: universal stress protein [bacterium]|nr:universal stress protein [bacterium]